MCFPGDMARLVHVHNKRDDGTSPVAFRISSHLDGMRLNNCRLDDVLEVGLRFVCYFDARCRCVISYPEFLTCVTVHHVGALPSRTGKC